RTNPLSTKSSALSLHDALPISLLEAGIHCLVEKPLAATEPECMALIAAAKAGSAALLVGHIERFNPAVEALAARGLAPAAVKSRSEEHTSELQSRENIVCRPLL